MRRREGMNRQGLSRTGAYLHSILHCPGSRNGILSACMCVLHTGLSPYLHSPCHLAAPPVPLDEHGSTKSGQRVPRRLSRQDFGLFWLTDRSSPWQRQSRTGGSGDRLGDFKMLVNIHASMISPHVGEDIENPTIPSPSFSILFCSYAHKKGT